MSQRELIVKYVDSGRPIISIRTGNHGFHAALPYKINGKQVRWGEDVLGGSFMSTTATGRPTPRAASSWPSKRIIPFSPA
jgi:hypothetical protein